MELKEKRFKKMFPHLAEEMSAKHQHVGISSVRSNVETAEKAASRTFDGYMPDAIDFIRRCDTEQQAMEIIDFLEKRQEINKQYAEKLRVQIREKGVRSFGPKKQDDYYSRHGLV